MAFSKGVRAAALLTTAGFAAAAGGETAALPTFDEYVKKHGLTFWGDEHHQRREIYDAALQHIEEHNQKKDSLWKAGVNRLTVMRPEERNELYGYVRQGQAGQKPAAGSPRGVPKRLADKKDWREHQPIVVTAVKNQGSCGSCWAFAATAVMESAIAIATDTLFELSPQQLTSCTPNPHECGGSGGCTGATAQLAFNYTINSGMSSLWTWPYTSGIWKSGGECYEMTGKKTPVAGITGYQQLPQNDAEALMEAVLVNPVSVSVAASYWHFYESGIFNGCEKEHPIVNHAVVLMGYGEEDGTHYWLVRNSWGPTWGELGYIRLQRFPGNEPCGDDNQPLSGYSCKDSAPDSIRACGMCGILADSAYPTGGFLGTPQDPDDPALDDTKQQEPKAEESVVSDAELFGASVAAEPKSSVSASVPSVPLAACGAAMLTLVVLGTFGAWRRRAAATTEYSGVAPLVAEAA